MDNQNATNNIVERLFGSFKLLENAIINAKETLHSKPNVKPEVLVRLDSYAELLIKQKDLAVELQNLIDANQWPEVAQKISVINGLLEMIREDAREVLQVLHGVEKSEDSENSIDKPILM